MTDKAYKIGQSGHMNRTMNDEEFRTFAELTADSVLSHTRYGIRRGYGHSDIAVLKKDAPNRWTEHLDSIRAS